MNLKAHNQLGKIMPKAKQRYTRMDPVEHVLKRPDTYVGSVRSRRIEEFVVADEEYHISKQRIEISPAILRIFVEPLSNMIDNWARSKKGKNKVTEMRVTLDSDTGETSFWNNGNVIPIEMHEEEKCYNHSLIFGNLLTGENYDDDEEREDISGRNGIGIKACNVFSSMFMVEGVDPKKKKYLKQVWTKNMTETSKPMVTKTDEKQGYTKVTYVPDFSRFGLESYTDDIVSLYKRYLVDAAMITKVPFFFNDELIPVENLEDYAKLYSSIEREMLHIKTKNCEVLVMESNEFEVISFANGVYTPLGGTHVESWVEGLFRPLVQKLNKPKKPQLNIKDVKQFFRLFVVATVVNPEFNTQSKEKLEAPTLTAEVKKTHISAICKWPVMERLEDIIRNKELAVLKKVERKRKYVKVEGLESANNEGGPLSHECTLILVEGLGAKAYAVEGISKGVFGKKGRDWNGILPLRGKILNTRNAATKTIASNAVIGNIIKALGVKTDVDYTIDAEYKKLRYGKVLIITDQDYDGLHISGLIQNMFHSLYPSLLCREQPFCVAMNTLIVRVYLSPTKSRLFYDENEYRRFVVAYNKKYPGKKINKKYYKGLGSNNEDDIEESFGRKLVEFKMDDKTFETMTKAFHKKHAEGRRQWLANYDPNKTVIKWKGNETEVAKITFSEFIDTELIRFSHDDCARSIPSLMDGLKCGHRKVLYSCFLRNLKTTGKTLKVAQLAGYVSEKSGYHHGEQNLHATITGMAQSFVGSNNIPLLFRDGQFGTRLSGGKDAAPGRYIWTRMEPLTRLIFRPEDDILLSYREDDGEKVEPYFYVPILPMILVNGTVCGIGTGWSSNVPCYNPLDLIAAIRIWLENNGNVIIKNENTTISLLPDLVPWYRGFTGEIVLDTKDSHKFISWGRISKKGAKTVVEELPVGMWTDNFMEKLQQWKVDKEIKDFKNHSTVKDVNFVITESEDGISCTLENLKLYKGIRTSNMCLFNEHDQLRKFNSVDEIIDSFCTVRLTYYIKRKQHQLKEMEKKIKMMGNKKRFLIEVRNGQFKLFDEINGKRRSRKTTDMIAELEERGYDRDGEIDNDEDEDEEEEKGTKGYDYLLRLQFRSITEEKIDKLKKDIASLIRDKDILAGTAEKDLWLQDLKEFEDAYHKWLEAISKERVKKPRKKD
uniref:DNA topoisomerase (ATP-hydrolyzing) n=1 Tax=viral metagenome TaxID=1070528 RepID=A0A6C0EMJ0_9ZZZZ